MSKPEHIKPDGFLAGPRKVSDGRGNVGMYLPHGCDHYEEIEFVLADSEIRMLVAYAVDPRDKRKPTDDTPALREAMRTLVGWGMDEEGTLWVAVCHDDRCYPGSFSDQQIASYEAFIHGVITKAQVGGDLAVTGHGPITNVTVPGPLAYCAKVCYSRTSHFFDVEVWEEPEREGQPEVETIVGQFSGQPMQRRVSGKLYQIVLRCEECHHGYDLVTKEGSPSRWKRLMKDETARSLLAGAQPRWES